MKYRYIKKGFPFEEETDYPEEVIEEGLDSNALESDEAGFLNGYNNALVSRKRDI
jgi:hypothetical protein